VNYLVLNVKLFLYIMLGLRVLPKVRTTWPSTAGDQTADPLTEPCFSMGHSRVAGISESEPTFLTQYYISWWLRHHYMLITNIHLAKYIKPFLCYFGSTLNYHVWLNLKTVLFVPHPQALIFHFSLKVAVYNILNINRAANNYYLCKDIVE